MTNKTKTLPRKTSINQKTFDPSTLLSINLNNLIFLLDSYKGCHSVQYRPDIVYMESYTEPRSNKMYDEVVLFGVQTLLKRFIDNPITEKDVIEAEIMFSAMNTYFDRDSWMKVVNVYGGHLPVKIYSVEEGTVQNTGLISLSVRCDDPDLFWLGSAIETMLVRQQWYMSNVSTLSFQMKRIIRNAMEISCDTLDKLPWMLHDFGARGASSAETAALGALSHLVHFNGTDTVIANVYAAKYYGANTVGTIAGTSVNAAEHSTITSWGRDSEVDAYSNILDLYLKPNTAVAVVSDSYNLFNAITNLWGDVLRDRIVNSQGVLIIRPDSGDPAEILVKSLDLLGDRFGFVYNSKGFKVLPDCVRLIQGDGITRESLPEIVKAILAAGWSMDNVSFGMGGGLLQDHLRDDQSWCQKASVAKLEDGTWIDIYKDPITSGGSKTSKRGCIRLILRDGVRMNVREEEILETDTILQELIYDYGTLVKEYSFQEIRDIASKYM